MIGTLKKRQLDNADKNTIQSRYGGKNYRRIIVYKGRNVHEGMYFVSQEFNGDREEALHFNPHTPISINWNEVVSYFNNIDSLHNFRNAVMMAENMYTYENISLRKTDELPRCEEIWMLIDGELQLYSKYGELV